MKKTFKLRNLDCAHCAEKMERASEKIDGVNSVKFNFMMQKVKVDADESRFDAIINEIQKCISNVDSDCELVR